MRDAALLLILCAFVGAALYRPWLGVLGLTVLSFLHPQSWGHAFMDEFPSYAVLLAATLVSTLSAVWRTPGELQRPPLDWRLALLILLWAYFLFTTFHARAPFSAWDRFYDVTKVLLPFALVLVLIDTRAKLRLFLGTTALCIGLLAAKGGYWAILTGFANRVMGPPASELHDNNHFAVAAIMTLPLLVLWRQTARGALRQLLLPLLMGLCVLAALSSWSRGALLALGATLALIALLSRRRLLALSAIGALLFLGFSSLPEGWYERMGTILAYAQDESAQNRLAVWERGIDYAMDHPFTGTGFRGWRYITFGVGRIDWHSAYVQVLAEHGVVAFALWSILLFGSIAALMYAGMSVRRSAADPWMRDWGTLLATSLAAYAIGAAFLSLAYWDLLYQVLIMGVLAQHIRHRGSPSRG